MIELEKINTPLDQILKIYDQARAQIEQGGCLSDAVMYSLAKAMHDCYSRAITAPQAGEGTQVERTGTIEEIRKFYEETFVHISQTA